MEEEAREAVKSHINIRGGTRFVDRRPEFSDDAKYLMCCCGPNVKVLSVTSGETVHILQGHTGNVTGVKLNPNNKLQLISSSLDRSIIKWNFKDGMLVKRYLMQAPICALYTDHQFFYAICQKPNNAVLVRFTLPNHDEMIEQVKTIISNVDPLEKHVSVSREGKYAASVVKKKLTVCEISTNTTTVHKLAIQQYDKTLVLCFTCVTCHPSEYCVATGINDGRIVLWYNFMKTKSVVTSIVQWHFVHLFDLMFTEEGSYLLSGGSECVLVKWQWNTNHKDFLPRLKSPIIGISCSHDNTHYALCHKDNGIQVVSSNFNFIQLYQGLTQAYLEHEDQFGIIAGLTQDPRTGAIVTNGKPGYLQFYDIHNDKLKFNLDVVSQNFTTPDNLKHPHTITKIECVAFNSSGDWLATFERWDDGQMTPEMRLKFWVYVVEKQNFKLNTLVDMPHKKKVNIVRFFPTVENSNDCLMAVTASDDGTFKLWTLVDDTNIYRKNQCWSCESVGFFRDQIPRALDISEDGTLLAVAFDSCVTLWDPETNELTATLVPYHGSQLIRHLLFSSGSCSHFLIGATSDRLYVWNLLSLTVSWSTSLCATVMVKCPKTDLIAIFTDNLQLHIYTPKCSKPVWSRSKVSKTDVMAAIFLTNSSGNKGQGHGEGKQLLPWQHVAELFYVNKKHEFLTLDTCKMKTQSPAVVLAQNVPQTPFSILLSSKRKVDEVKTDKYYAGVKRNQSAEILLKEILSTPAHVLPPVSTLAMNFLDTLLIPNPSVCEDEQSDDLHEKREDKDQHSVITTENSDDDDEVDEMEVHDSRTDHSSQPASMKTQEFNEEQKFIEERHEKYKQFTRRMDASEVFNWLC